MTRPTINEILRRSMPDNCVECDAKLVWEDRARGMDDPPWFNGRTCSEPCFRKWAGKTWPKEEDCPGCPCHKDGPHKFGCTIYGARVIKIPVHIKD